MDHLQPVGFENVEITGGFWAQKQKLNREVTIYAVRDRFEDTGRFKAFDFEWREGSDLPRPHFFWDSDVAKWLESAAYIIQQHPDSVLQDKIEAVIDQIERNQCEDGYFNIYHTIVEPELRFRNRDHHELYCLGHLIEAAVAYYNATGRDRFLLLIERYVDLVIRVFTVERSAEFVTPGHEEIELALMKLYRLRGDRKYLDLAMFFLNERGKSEEFVPGWSRARYFQSHLPVRSQHTAEGHAVRACYLYSGMADAVKETGDEAMFAACKDLFDDICRKKMYITGGVGSSHHGEAFTIAYDLPNDTAYAETCAAIALSLFADRMKLVDADAKYADIVEREWYNGALSGLSLDGKAFFYENPLEINLADHKRNTGVTGGERLPITERKEVFDCSCCPPNVTRYLASLGGSVFSTAEGRIYLHQFMPLRAAFDGAQITVETDYPRDGSVRVHVRGAKGRQLCVRIPGWCRAYTFSAPYENDRGYAVIDLAEDDVTIDVTFEMPPTFYRAHPLVRADAGKAALMRGPVVYCMEGADNGEALHALTIDTAAEAQIAYDPASGLDAITLHGTRAAAGLDAALYDVRPAAQTPVSVKMIPYHAFANRGPSDMAVWFRVK